MHISVRSALSPTRRRPQIVEAAGACPALAVAGGTRMPRRDAPRDTIRLRCLTPTDAHHMQELLERMSPLSRYQRYLRLVRSFTSAEIARFVAVGPGHLAVGAFDGVDLVGVAQYFRSLECPDQAEIAVEVADSHHRHGVGALLVKALAPLAAHDGITHFTATVLAENRAVLGLIRHSGWHILTTEDGPYVDVVVALPLELVGAGPRGPTTCRSA